MGVEVVLETMRKQEELCKWIIKLAVPRIAALPSCGCPNALQGAIITAPYAMPPDTKTDLDLIIGKYIN